MTEINEAQYAADKEKWYTPVDVGQEIDIGDIKEEQLSNDQAVEIFEQETILRKMALQEYEKLRDEWLKSNGDQYSEKFRNDRYFELDKGNHPVSAEIFRFSASKAKIYIKFLYGYSRWHHYYIALRDLLVERDPYIDEIFHLDQLEQLYSYSLNGVAHGTQIEEAEAILGKDYYEYAGQSPQYRNIYYERFDIEVVVQNWRVKYIQKGKPEWMYSEMKIKHGE